MSEQVSIDRREKALALHEEGLTIVPAHPIEKRPLIDWARFQHQDVTDDLIELWTSSARWKDCNWAIVTGKEVVVVDTSTTGRTKTYPLKTQPMETIRSISGARAAW